MKKNFKTLLASTLAAVMVLGAVGVAPGLSASVRNHVIGEDFTIPVPTAPGTTVARNARAVVDVSNAREGYIMVSILDESIERVMVLIYGPPREEGAARVRYQYTISVRGEDEWAVLPLTEGNGDYHIIVGRVVEGGRIASLIQIPQLTVNMVNEFAPFLHPSYVVNFNENSDVVEKAAYLTRNSRTVLQSVRAIYNFVIENIEYDHDWADEVIAGRQGRHIVDIDAVLYNRRGVCSDYSALIAAMFRSIGIPTRVNEGWVDNVPGNTRPVFHAWIEIFIPGRGWVGVVEFDGNNWGLLDPTFSSTGGAAARRIITNTANYRFTHRF